MLIQYVRDKNNHRVGVVVAEKPSLVDKGDGIGWSKCHSRLDKFDKKMGIKIAYGRAISGKQYKETIIPHDVQQVIKKMKKRAKSYYKCESTSVVNSFNESVSIFNADHRT